MPLNPKDYVFTRPPARCLCCPISKQLRDLPEPMFLHAKEGVMPAREHPEHLGGLLDRPREGGLADRLGLR